MSDLRVEIHSIRDCDGEKELRRWQADIVLPDGNIYHARMETPYDALLELALFWKQKVTQSGTSGENISPKVSPNDVL